MKVCSRCGLEISTPDGVNICSECLKKPFRKVKAQKADIEDVLEGMGLKKVKGAMGGTYWE